MIPKTIHYCWFGRNPKPSLANKCIKSWKKYCPDYEIIEWNEDNFDISSAPLYVRQAYEAKKWAFVTDYVRLWAMTEFGGIYMDTDVEVLRPLDEFLDNEAFSGFENEISVPTGIMACRKGYPLFVELMSFYDTALFVNPDGSLNIDTNVVTITGMCLKHGLQQNGKFQQIKGFTLYPRDVFCPLDYATGKMYKTDATATIHWFSGSWHSAYEKKRRQKELWDARIHRMTRPLNRIGRKILSDKVYYKIRDLIAGKK